MTLARRQFVVTMRNRAFLRGKAVLVTVMALLYGSAFYQFDFKDVQVGLGVIFLSALYLALAQSPMLPLYYDARRVFYKQRRANFYPTSAFVLSIAASQIPMTLFETIVFGSIIYGMCGLVPSIGAYVTFEVVLLSCSLSFAGIYFCIMCFTPDIHVGKPLCLVWLLLGVVYAGFIVPYGQFPAYIEWLYWLDPISWGMRAIAISQYRSSRYDVDVYDGIDYKGRFNKTMGEFYISFFDIETERAWIAYGVLYSLSFYAAFMFLATLILERKRLEAPTNVMLQSNAEEERGSYAAITTPKANASKTNTESTVTVSIATHTRHFTPVTVAFQDLWYTVPSPTDKNATIDLLKGAVLGREGVSTPSASVGEIKFDNKRAASSWVQAKMVMRRFFRMYWRTPTYNYTRMLVALFLGLLFGLTFFDSKFDTYQGINGGVGTLYVAIIFVGVVAMQSMIVLASEVRASFYRERASQTYNAFWYFLGFTVVEIPYVFFSTLLFAAIFFPMAGFSGLSNFLFYWTIMSLLGLVQVYLGQLFAFALPSAEVAVLASVFINSVFGLWAGFNPPGSAVPAGYRWLYDSIPQRYALQLVGGFLLADCSKNNKTGCIVISDVPNVAGPISVEAYLDKTFEIRYSDLRYNFLMLIIMIAVIRVLTLLVMRFVNKQKK
ncbi:hypothetical protein P43SY_008004 [Pythium insidiosum]|uniref:ABC-2 type transporter transmembrane domain-containing protein n=1 Tax=Pythium insidiosum TaxID=114742 RepID=A0AAD5LNK9_PYTIN|nr:hypothetical protein P43SY_008004 [Pythium insidiosum]